MKVLHLDYETYSEANLKTVGSFKYTRHPSFEVLCFSYCIGDDPSNIKNWNPALPIPQEWIDAMEDPNVQIAAWNATFEKNVTDMWFRKLGLSKPPTVERYLDVQAIATRHNYPQSLDKAAPAMGLPEVKDQRGKYLINKLTKPKKWSRATPWTRWTPENAPQDFQDFYEYCDQDVRTEMAVHRFLPKDDLEPFERNVWIHTCVQNTRGVRVDLPLVRRIVQVMDEWGSMERAKLSELTGGIITTPDQRQRIIDYAYDRFKVRMPNMQAETVDKALAHPRIPEEFKQLLRIRKNLAKTSTAKFRKMLLMADKRGFVRGNLIYAPTVTGRYTATGIQIQNMPRKCVKDPDYVASLFMDGLDAIQSSGVLQDWDGSILALASGMVRACVIPPDGFDLIVTDFSSVENRFLHWVAGDVKTCEEFAAGLDQYKTFAADRYGVPYNEVNDAQRFHGKTAILGLGFMMGDKQYQATAAGYGLEFSDEQAKEDVQFYRNKYTEVRKLWFQLYEAAMECVNTGLITQYGRIKFGLRGDRLYMRLPSGRMIVYNNPRIEPKKMPWGQTKNVITFMGINPYNGHWQRLQITPGRLTENVVQAGCRDILVEGLWNVEQSGIYKPVGSMHDEGISYVKENEGTVEEYDYLIQQVGDWAEGLPLTSKGYRAKRYRKD